MKVGGLKRETQYINNNKQGIEKEYGENGVLIRETSFLNNQANGIEKIYDSYGTLVSQYKYRNGIKIIAAPSEN